MGNTVAQNREWEAWQTVCRLLKESGAVTDADLRAPARGLADTKGKTILHAIQTWGVLYRQLDGPKKER